MTGGSLVAKPTGCRSGRYRADWTELPGKWQEHGPRLWSHWRRSSARLLPWLQVTAVYSQTETRLASERSLLCAIVLVEERTEGTLGRMLITGYHRPEILGGYLLGYLGLATLQAVAALSEVLILFYANRIIQVIIVPNGDLGTRTGDVAVLVAYGLVLLVVASRTLAETD